MIPLVVLFVRPPVQGPGSLTLAHEGRGVGPLGLRGAGGATRPLRFAAGAMRPGFVPPRIHVQGSPGVLRTKRIAAACPARRATPNTCPGPPAVTCPHHYDVGRLSGGRPDCGLPRGTGPHAATAQPRPRTTSLGSSVAPRAQVRRPAGNRGLHGVAADHATVMRSGGLLMSPAGALPPAICPNAQVTPSGHREPVFRPPTPV